MFIFLLVFGMVFLDVIRLVEYGNDEILLFDKFEWVFVGCILFIRVVYCFKYLKWRIRYSYGYFGLFNFVVIMNKEVYMIYGNMDKEIGIL